MRFAWRTFLLSLLPFAALLTASFWTIQHMTVVSVRNELRSSLRQMQASTARVIARSELQNRRFLRVIGDNAPLKASMQLILAERDSGDARRTVEDQLREICTTLNFDFLLASDADGNPLAGIMRVGDQFVAMDTSRITPPQHGAFNIGALTYQVNSVPLSQGTEDLGLLSVGEQLDFTEFSTPAVLARGGKVIKSSVPDVSAEELTATLSTCPAQAGCELTLRGQTYLALPVDGANFGDGYVLRSLQNVDSSTAPVLAMLRRVFMLAGVGALVAATILSALISRSIVKPIAGVVEKLRKAASTGSLPEFAGAPASIHEIRELMDAFNRAACAIRDGDENLHQAYVEFVHSLAGALDARDRYTAGHSRRVSEYSCAVAQALKLDSTQIDTIRIGALLHDIGKIGISDVVLLKPGRLTDEEMALIQQHPTIGRRILEGVHGFEPYLPTVELHHENWDGTGYPLGLSGEAVPLEARIVHVADAYDAMTSHRPYRRGMPREDAVALLNRFSGTQFDPRIVKAFTAITGMLPVPEQNDLAALLNLARTVEHAQDTRAKERTS